jgi:hypothetical protein
MDESSALRAAIVVAAILGVGLVGVWIASIRLFVRYPIHATLRVSVTSLAAVIVYLLTPHFSVTAKLESAVDLGVLSLRTVEPIFLSNQVDPGTLSLGSVLMALIAAIALLRVRQ